MRAGKICKTCKVKCKDEPNESSPVVFDCPACNGHGCDSCDDGRVFVTSCPSKYVGDMWATIELINFFEDGKPPIAGGILDQSASFISAARTLKNLDNQQDG